jgi:hypothetical protein
VPLSHPQQGGQALKKTEGAAKVRWGLRLSYAGREDKKFLFLWNFDAAG